MTNLTFRHFLLNESRPQGRYQKEFTEVAKAVILHYSATPVPAQPRVRKAWRREKMPAYQTPRSLTAGACAVIDNYRVWYKRNARQQGVTVLMVDQRTKAARKLCG